MLTSPHRILLALTFAFLSGAVIYATPCPCETEGGFRPITPRPVRRLVEEVRKQTLAVPRGFTSLGRDTDPLTSLPMRLRHDRTGYELVLVPTGSYTIGSPPNRGAPHEKPQHVAQLSAYWIGVTEVSTAQYRRLASVRGRRAQASLPAVNVTWDEAKTWCDSARLRLPTEAEWEAAARGCEAFRYPWGNDWNSARANLTQSNKASTSYRSGASPYGCLGMAGNPLEWCANWYEDDFYVFSPDVNPRGPAYSTHSARVVRGMVGDLSTGNGMATRSYRLPGQRDGLLGFRAAVSPVIVAR